MNLCKVIESHGLCWCGQHWRELFHWHGWRKPIILHWFLPFHLCNVKKIYFCFSVSRVRWHILQISLCLWTRLGCYIGRYMWKHHISVLCKHYFLDGIALALEVVMWGSEYASQPYFPCSHWRIFICDEADILSPVSVTASVRPSGLATG